MAKAVEAPASITAEGPTSHTQNQDLDALLGRLEQSLNEKATPSGTYGYTRQEQIEALHKLREPFSSSEVRYRPQPWCKACSGQKSWPKVCERHTEIKCQRCNGQKITEAHICLKYIGHAEATNRLLNVDPFWDWEPMALDASGLPQYDGNRALWIRLTVCGMTRIGYGDATGKDGANAVKEIIGDAIRNAAMRFGMALDLWTSSDLEIIESGVPPEGEAKPSPSPSPKPAPGQEQGQGGQEGLDAALARLTEQYRNCWGNALALTQIRIEGKKLGLSATRVQGPPPESAWTTFDELLVSRIDELKAAQGGAGEGQAA